MMEFQGIKQINIDALGLSQIYISREKYVSVKKWFQPENMDAFQPVSVYNFGNGVYTLTDGHTRTLLAYEYGLSAVPAVYDDDDIVTGPIGQKLYKADIEIKHLKNRILSKSLYERLWIERCNRSYNLIMGTTGSERGKLQGLNPTLFLYGASEDMSELYFENASGDLFVYREHILLTE